MRALNSFALINASVLSLYCVSVAHASGQELIPLRREALLEFSPRANQNILNAIASEEENIRKSGINTELRTLHFVSQAATETGGFRRLDENLNYSAQRLREVFSRRVSADDAVNLAYQPSKIANHVYSNRLGNGGPQTNDGWNYRGSGFLQLTGRANFRARGIEISMPLEASPDLVRQPKAGLTAAIAYWTARNINHAADKDDIVEVRRLVNGGRNGLAAAKIWYLEAKKKLFGRRGAPADLTSIIEEESKAVTEALSELGYALPKGVPGSADSLQDALSTFQKDKGLKQTGFLDTDTLYAITDPDGRFDE